MSYRNLLVKNLAKSLQGRCYTAADHARSRSAYLVCSRELRSRSSSQPSRDPFEEHSLSETEAMLHQSLQRCRNIYGLIENSTRDFENEVKLIERIFNKYNDLATQKGSKVHEIMQKISEMKKEAEMKKEEAEKKEASKRKDVVKMKKECPFELAEEKCWDDLPEHTARCPVPEEESLYKVFIDSMVAKPEEPYHVVTEPEKYPDPDAADIYGTHSERLSPLGSSRVDPRFSRKLSTGKPVQQARSDVEVLASQPRQTSPVLLGPLEPTPAPKEPFIKPANTNKSLSSIRFLTSEMHRDNNNLRKPKSEVYVSLPRRTSDFPNKIEQFFKVRYGKAKFPKVKPPQFTETIFEDHPVTNANRMAVNKRKASSQPYTGISQTSRMRLAVPKVTPSVAKRSKMYVPQWLNADDMACHGQRIANAIVPPPKNKPKELDTEPIVEETPKKPKKEKRKALKTKLGNELKPALEEILMGEPPKAAAADDTVEANDTADRKNEEWDYTPVPKRHPKLKTDSKTPPTHVSEGSVSEVETTNCDSLAFKLRSKRKPAVTAKPPKQEPEESEPLPENVWKMHPEVTRIAKPPKQPVLKPPKKRPLKPCEKIAASKTDRKPGLLAPKINLRPTPHAVSFANDTACRYYKVDAVEDVLKAKPEPVEEAEEPEPEPPLSITESIYRRMQSTLNKQRMEQLDMEPLERTDVIADSVVSVASEQARKVRRGVQPKQFV